MDLQLEQITYRADGNPVPEDKDVGIPLIEEEDYKERLKEIDETYQIIHDRKTGRAFEIAIVNSSQLRNGAILTPSTMFSSLTQNPGNAIELAAHGAATPHMARVYLAFPGNGGSDSLSRQDRRYLARTGRFTRNGEAVESILALVRALEDQGIEVRYISADIEGGRLGLGIMAALPPDTVHAAYFNGIPGISPLEHDSYITIMLREDRQGQQARLKDDPHEPQRVSDRTVQEAKLFLANIYRSPHYRKRFLSTYVRALPNMIANIKGFRQFDELQASDTHAVFQDTLAALRRQKQATITFQFGLHSDLHSIMQCRRFGQKITEELGEAPNQGRIQLFIHKGTLDFHTIHPSQRWAAEKEALQIP